MKNPFYKKPQQGKLFKVWEKFALLSPDDKLKFFTEIDAKYCGCCGLKKSTCGDCQTVWRRP